MNEVDPNGKSANEPGAKLDSGKVRPALVIQGFRKALLSVSEVGTFGAAKYTDNGWKSVPDGRKRYEDALYRHLLAEGADEQSGLPHLAHAAWNLLAMLELEQQHLDDLCESQKPQPTLELEISDKDVAVSPKGRPIKVDFLLGKSDNPYQHRDDSKYNFPPSFMDSLREKWEKLATRSHYDPVVTDEDEFTASECSVDGIRITEFCPKDRNLAMKALEVRTGGTHPPQIRGVLWLSDKMRRV